LFETVVTATRCDEYQEKCWPKYQREC